MIPSSKIVFSFLKWNIHFLRPHKQEHNSSERRWRVMEKDEGALKSSNNEANIIVLFVSWQYANGRDMAIVGDERGMAERNFLRLLAPQTRTIIINELLGKVYE